MAAGAEGTARRTDELLRKSGLWEQLGYTKPHVKAAALRETAKGRYLEMSPPDFARLEQAIDFAYAPEKLRATAARELALLPVEDEETALSWLSSELGMRITRREEENWQPETAAKIRQESARILESAPNHRLETCRSVNEALASPDETASGFVDILAGIAYGWVLVVNPSDTAAAEAVRERLLLRRAQMNEQFDKDSIVECVHAYRDLSDDEFDRHVAFTRSPAGSRLHQVLNSAALKATALASLELVRHFGRADQLMHASGLWAQIAHLGTTIRMVALAAQSMAKSRGDRAAPGEEEMQLVLGAIDAAYAPQPFRERMSKDLAGLLSIDDETEVMGWLRSDLARRITQREGEAADPGKAMEIARELPRIIGSISGPRGETYKGLNSAMGLSEAAVEAAIAAELAVAYGVALTHPEGNTSVVDAMRKRLESARALLAAQFTPMIIAKFAYVCDGLSEEELQRYVRFAESPAARRFHAARTKALSSNLARTSLELGRLLGEALGKQPVRPS